jgi:AraC-like DNA-binding protein/mannose-6-phosphate isomerase-like protein (cupin superfamily)
LNPPRPVLQLEFSTKAGIFDNNFSEMTTAALRNKTIIKNIKREMQRFPAPRNYWIGKNSSGSLKPRNILIFQRRDIISLRHAGNMPDQHHRHVLIVAIQGTGKVGVDTRIHRLKEGQCLLVLPFQTHWYEKLSTKKILWLFVTFEHGRDVRLENFRNKTPVSIGTCEWSLLQDLLKEWKSPGRTDTLELRLTLLLQLLAQRSGQKIMIHDPRPIRGQREWIAEVNRLFFENRSKTLSLPYLAGKLNVSVSLLRGQFRQAAGKSIGKYVRDLKLRYSCELLRDGGLQVGEIAEHCGYDSVFSFSRAFHQRYKMSPSAYRGKVTSHP